MSHSESRVEVRGREVRVALKLNLLEMGNVDTNGDGAVSWDELDASIAGIYEKIRQHYILGDPEPPASVTLRYGVSDGHVLDADLVYKFQEEVRQLSVTSTLDRLALPGHQHLISVRFGGEPKETVLRTQGTRRPCSVVREPRTGLPPGALCASESNTSSPATITLRFWWDC